MARKRYTAEQIIGYLRQAEILLGQGQSMADVLRALDVTGNTYYRWRKEYGGLGLDQARRLKELEQENARLICLALSLETGLGWTKKNQEMVPMTGFEPATY